MKKLFILLLLILSYGYSNAVTVYISTSGNNANAGTLAAPWRTLAYAGSHTSNGDIIHVLPGTFTESATCNLPVGVSIEGEGVTSWIVSTYTGGAAINLVSNTDGVNGNQHISNIRLSGSNLTGRKAIYVLARSNVKIYNCTIEDFLEDGVIFKGAVGGGQPTVYATGNELHDCIITNNSDRATGQGNIVATGYRGMLIYNNTLTQTSRPLGNNGNTYSATTEGFCEGLKFYGNKSYRNPSEVTNWSFHLELWDSQGGMEFYNNEFYNGAQAIDFGGHDLTKGSYAYGAWIHDNYFYHDVVAATGCGECQVIGVNIEGNCEYITIEDNHFENMPYGVQIPCGHTDVGTHNITIQNNLFQNGGYTNTDWAFDIDILGEGQGSTIRFIYIYNNTIITRSLSALFISPHANDIISDIYFRNNIVQGVRSYGYITFNNAPGTKTNYTVSNNVLYQNANSNGVSLQSGGTLPTGWTTPANTIIANPLLDATFHLTASSPAINAGVNVGLPFTPPAPDCGCFEYPGSTAPVANAGTDQTITLPTNSVTLTGSATTTISTWNWTKLSGSPVTGSISNPNTQTTSAINLVQGTYQFQLLVVNTAGLFDVDTVSVTVNAAPTTPPTCTAGSDKTITLPTNIAAMNGVATAGSSAITSVLWTNLNSVGTIANPNGATTAVSGFTVPGTSFYKILVTDANTLTCTDTMSVTVLAAPVVPTANAGIDQVLTLPTNSTTLNGSGSGGTINSYRWTIVQGVGGTLSASTSATTNISGLIQGTYKVELRVGNTAGNFGYDTMQILVRPAIVLPTATCAPNITITLPTNFCTLVGVGTGTQTPLSFQWTKITLGGVLTTPTQTQTQFTTLPAASYAVEYKVTDNDGNSARDTIIVTVLPAPIIPTANAGTNQTITLPTNSVSLTGSGSGGTINGYQWTKLSGVGGTFSAATSANTNFSGLVQGVYQVELRVSNTDGNFGRDTVQITVLPAIVLPTATCASNITINLPVNFCTLVGVGTGTQTPLTYQWTKLTGTGGTLTTATATQTTFTGLTAGTYTIEYKVTDNNGNIARDTMSVNVVAALAPPTVSAGADQTLVSPTTTATLAGTVVLGSGTVTSYEWLQISGSSTTITTPTLISTGITGLTVGDFYYSLRVVTSDGYAVADTVMIRVVDNLPLQGIKGFNIVLNNGKAKLNWEFIGADGKTSFVVYRKTFLWYKKIGNVFSSIGKNFYTYTDMDTKRGSSFYYFKYANITSAVLEVKKK